MPTVDYLLYDVFTDTPFAGNPLAVAIDPPPLDSGTCQLIARELNLSETVFLDTTTADGVAARIFTPTGELPFAGHPTIGAALALAEEGLAESSVVLHERVGPVRVTIDAGVATLTTPATPRSVPDTADPEDVARCLGLGLGDLHPTFGVRAWSAGVPFTIVSVRDVETLGRIHVDLGWWRETVALTSADQLYALTPLDGPRGRRWRARMFAPAMGIPEDPATGAAAAAASGYLAGHASELRLEEGWIIEQGVEMGRPSELRVGAVRRGSELVAATVGGQAVRVGRGQIVS